MLKNMSTGGKIYLAFSLVALAAIVSLTFASVGINKIQDQLHSVGGESLKEVAAAGTAQATIQEIKATVSDLITSADTQTLEVNLTAWSELKSAAEAEFAEVLNSGSLSEEGTTAIQTTSNFLAELDAQAIDTHSQLSTLFQTEAQVRNGAKEFLLQSNYLIGDIERISAGPAAEDGYIQNLLNEFKAGAGQMQFIAANLAGAISVTEMEAMLKALRVYAEKTQTAVADLEGEVPAIANSAETAKYLVYLMENAMQDKGTMQRLIDVQKGKIAIQKQKIQIADAVNQQAAALKQYVDKVNSGAEQVVENADGFVSTVLSVVVASILITLGVIVFSSTALSRSIRRPIEDLARVAGAMANGDFTARMKSGWGGEFAQVSEWFNAVGSSTNASLNKIKDVTDELESMSASNANATTEVQTKIAEQNGQLGSIAAAITEMSAANVEINDVTHRAEDQSLQTQERVAKGAEIMQSNQQTIGNLSEHVNQTYSTLETVMKDVDDIESILGVISSIAESTNLLALNAAIEAARAGEQGRGFAVVADEVRNLSQRTAEQTTEIQDMISRLTNNTRQSMEHMNLSREAMSQSVDINNELTTAFDEINGDIMLIRDMSAQISAATTEQQAASEEITQNINTLAAVAEENSATVEQLAQEGKRLSELSSEQEENISSFTLEAVDEYEAANEAFRTESSSAA